ncbi:translesion DNA synthesis-associated protein ImuA [Paraburkholderia humisilvae]|uniref:Cell division inhibitor SulA n=1 Tax=Paraburkholderia humisilvae TaxID=627669 RepID=A0A6J5F663_9BURK|nr:translesion DNA synthesis-associated protein ImuA [Paraburkholderia humisilvae]CAB3774279.1 hypothetical protein LMG29542_07688 [Paraburkholderia humisilvae]
MPAAVERHSPEEIHPSIWRASQLARRNGRSIATGYASLSAELSGGVWPLGALIEFLPQCSGVGELRLLQPALSSLRKRPIGLIAPTHPLNGPGLGSTGLPLAFVVQARAPKMADKLWAAEQMLAAGSFGALVLWLQQVPHASLRRLHLAAQSSETLFAVVRPETAALATSPATLRLGLRPIKEGLAIDILKRLNPVAAKRLTITTQSPMLYSRHRRVCVLMPITAQADEAAVEA